MVCCWSNFIVLSASHETRIFLFAGIFTSIKESRMWVISSVSEAHMWGHIHASLIFRTKLNYYFSLPRLIFAVRCLSAATRSFLRWKPERKINQLMITFQFLPRLTDIECWPKDKIFNFIFHRRKQTAFDFESETMCRAHSPAWLFGFSVKWIYFYVTAKSVTWRNYLTLSSTSSLVLRDETRIYFDMEDIKRAMKQTTMATS